MIILPFQTYSIEELRKGITLEELKKATALEIHNQAYKEQALYNLPYRIVYDYHYNRIYEYEKYDYESRVPLNVCYPLLGIPTQGKWSYDTDGHYTAEEWEQITAVYITCKDGKVIKDIMNRQHIPPEIQALMDEKARQYSLCNIDTAAGLQAWVYYFMVFIMPYADTIKDFTQFDMYGDTSHTDQELNERKKYYLDMIRQCQEQPKMYKAEMVRYDDDTSNLDILYSERDTMPYYKRECKHKDTMQYRLKWLIGLFEQE